MLSQDQMSKMEQIHKDLVGRMEKRYTAMNEHVTDVNLLSIDETTYGAYLDGLSDPTLTYTFTVAASEGNHWNCAAVWTYSNPVAYEFMKFAGQEKVYGPLIEEEWKVISKVLTADLADFEAVWNPTASTQVSDAELETNKERATVLDREEPVILVGMDSHMQHASGPISLAYQKSGLATVLGDS